MILAMIGASPRRIGTGLFVDCGFNFGNCVDKTGLDEHWFDESDPIPAYGVADSVEQFLEKFKTIIEASDYGYAVGFTEVNRSEQSREGGWRWHKWGEYIGKREPQCEYLHDEPDIESIVTFSVLRTKTKIR